MSKLIALMAAKFRCVAEKIPQVTSLSALVAVGLIWTSDLLVPIWNSFLLVYITVDSQISLHFVD